MLSASLADVSQYFAELSDLVTEFIHQRVAALHTLLGGEGVYICISYLMALAIQECVTNESAEIDNATFSPLLRCLNRVECANYNQSEFKLAIGFYRCLHQYPEEATQLGIRALNWMEWVAPKLFIYGTTLGPTIVAEASRQLNDGVQRLNGNIQTNLR